MINFDYGSSVSHTIPPRMLRDLNFCKSRMTPAAIAGVEAELDRVIASGEVHTSSWIPGSDWNGKPYQPIFDHGAKMNPYVAARYFGLFMWERVLDRERNFHETWACKHCDDQWGNPIKGRTYFILKQPPVDISTQDP